MKYSLLAAAIATTSIMASSASSQNWGGSAVEGFYSGIGAYAGSVFGPGGMVAGGAIGNATGSWVYDTQEQFWTDTFPSYFEPQYVQPNYLPYDYYVQQNQQPYLFRA